MADADGPDVQRLVHDLRTPLTIVEGFAHLLERDADTLGPDRSAEYALRIKAAAAEMRALLDAL